MPKLTALFEKNDYSEINKLVKYALNFILVLGIPSICGLEIIAPHLIVLAAGEEYIDAAPALRTLGMAMACSFIGGWIGNMTFIPAGKEKICLRVSIVSACINIILNLILIPRWGLYAAALTTFISELFGMICGFIFIDKRIKIDGLFNILSGPVVGGVGIVAIGWAIQHTLEMCWMVVAVTVVISIVWYLAVLYITKNEFFLSFARPIIVKIRRREY